VNRTTVPPPVTMVMEAAEAWLPARMEAVEERLRRLAEGHGEGLAADAGATLAAGGKRLRPMLVLLSAGPGAGEAAIHAATAVELVHMATLVHDDVLDAAPLRRGRPTVVARSGRDRALAVGDLLFSRAFAELGRDGNRNQVELLSTASVALALGELAQRRDALDVSISAARYLERCELKTGRLFECACLIGRLGEDREGTGPAPRAPGRTPLTALRTFGREIGLAFQLLDDVLDVTGPPERTGKARGTDLLDGTVTLPLILARERDRSLVELGLRELDAQGAEAVCDRIAATGVLDEVRAGARRRVQLAKLALQRSGFEPDQRQLLELVADGVVERYS
jgi:geranylgeranyl pyrophosphate synthase